MPVEKDNLRPVKMIICKGCGHEKKNHAKGFCDLCYNRARKKKYKAKKYYQLI